MTSRMGLTRLTREALIKSRLIQKAYNRPDCPDRLHPLRQHYLCIRADDAAIPPDHVLPGQGRDKMADVHGDR